MQFKKLAKKLVIKCIAAALNKENHIKENVFRIHSMNNLKSKYFFKDNAVITNFFLDLTDKGTGFFRWLTFSYIAVVAAPVAAFITNRT